MARIMIAALAVLGIGTFTLAVLADDKAEEPAKADSITFEVVKTEQGDAIQVTSGDVVFLVPSFTFPANDKAKAAEFTVKDEYITSHFDGGSFGFTALTMPLHHPPRQPQPAPPQRD